MKLSREARQSIQNFCCSLGLVSSMLAAPATHAFNRLDAIQALQSVSANWQDNEVEVWINNLKSDPDPGVLIGEAVKFSVESGSPGFFVVALIDAKGETTLISGEAGDPASQRLDFPPHNSDDVLEQGPPVGAQTVFVFSSDTEFKLQELGITPNERVVTLPKELGAIEKLASVLNQHGNSETLAMAPRYTYFVDNPVNKISTRGLRKVMRRKMEEVRTTPPVAVASKEPEPKVVVEAETESMSSTVSSALSLDIKFQYNSAALGNEGIEQLDVVGSVLVSLLETDSLPNISLEGHTDDTGAASYNMGLSDQRAKSARIYLIDTFGLPESSIKAYGMGESSPMVNNKDKTSRALNRRVELRVVK